MSIKIMTLVWDNAVVTGSELIVLLSLADWSDDTGLSWYGLVRIAQRSRISVRQAQRVLADLEEYGYIKRDERYRENGSHTSNYYQINIDRLQPVPVGGGDMGDTRGGDVDVTRGGDIAMSPPESSIKESSSLTIMDDEVQNILNLYEDVFGSPQEMMSKKIIPEAIKEYSAKDLREAIKLAGENGARSFTYVRRILENKAKNVTKNSYKKKQSHTAEEFAEHVRSHPEMYGE